MDHALHLALLGAAAGDPSRAMRRPARTVPHLAYGAVTAAVLERLDPR